MPASLKRNPFTEMEELGRRATKESAENYLAGLDQLEITITDLELESSDLGPEFYVYTKLVNAGFDLTKSIDLKRNVLLRLTTYFQKHLGETENGPHGGNVDSY